MLNVYYPGDSITLSLTTVEDATVTAFVQDSAKNMMGEEFEFSATEPTKYTGVYRVPADAEKGVYEIIATAKKGDDQKTVKGYFEIAEK